MYAGEYADIACLVDEEDYRYFTRWLWKPQINKNKIYFTRTQTVKENGIRLKSETVYLHIEILTRAAGTPPTARQIIADHLDGDSLNNRRCNLDWRTKRQNNQNRFGRAALGTPACLFASPST